MTTEQQKEIILKACVAANPEIWIQLGSVENDRIGLTLYNEEYTGFRPIRLADVLLALGGRNEHDIGKVVGLEMDGDIYGPTLATTKPLWDFHSDDLEHQSPPTIAFLANLLEHA
jgi:hypothetical protein